MGVKSVDELQKYAFSSKDEAKKKDTSTARVTKVIKATRITKKKTKRVRKKREITTESGESSDSVVTGEKVWTPLLNDNLRIVFVGFNPGTESWRVGHYYAHFSNMFWKIIYESGIVNRPVTPYDDQLLPNEFDIGFTDLVSRSTKGINDLTHDEMAEGVGILEQRLSSVRPKIVCIVGKGIWAAIYKAKTDKPLKQFDWGFQSETDTKMAGFASDYVCVIPSTSGLAAGVSKEEKLRLWKQLAEVYHSLASEV